MYVIILLKEGDRLENFIKKNINILIAIFLLISPFIDLATGVCLHYFHIQLTIGIIVRIIFFFFLCLIALLIYKKKELWLPYSIIGIYLILHIIGIFVYKEPIDTVQVLSFAVIWIGLAFFSYNLLSY